MFHNYALVNQYTKQVSPTSSAAYNPLRMTYGDIADPNSPAHPEQRFQTLSEDIVGEYRSKYGAGLDNLMNQQRGVNVSGGVQRSLVGANTNETLKLNETAVVEPVFMDSEAKTDKAEEISKEAFVRNHPINVPILERVSYAAPVKEPYSVKHKTSHFVEILIVVLFIMGMFVLINIYLTQQRLEIMLKYYADSDIRRRN